MGFQWVFYELFVIFVKRAMYKKYFCWTYSPCLRRWVMWRMNSPTVQVRSLQRTTKPNSRPIRAAISRTAVIARPIASDRLTAKMEKGRWIHRPNIFNITNLWLVVNDKCVLCAQICVLYKSKDCYLYNTPSWKEMHSVVYLRHKEEHQNPIGEPQGFQQS